MGLYPSRISVKRPNIGHSYFQNPKTSPICYPRPVYSAWVQSGAKARPFLEHGKSRQPDRPSQTDGPAQATCRPVQTRCTALRTIVEWFRRTKWLGGAFNQDWHQHRVKFERLCLYHDLNEGYHLEFIGQSLRAGAKSFSDVLTCAWSPNKQ